MDEWSQHLATNMVSHIPSMTDHCPTGLGVELNYTPILSAILHSSKITSLMWAQTWNIWSWVRSHSIFYQYYGVIMCVAVYTVEPRQGEQQCLSIRSISLAAVKELTQRRNNECIGHHRIKRNNYFWDCYTKPQSLLGHGNNTFMSFILMISLHCYL